MAPAAFTMPTTRFVAADVVAATLAVPTSASYPVNVKKLPSGDRMRRPSDVDDPAVVSLRFAPLTAVGIKTDCTADPLAVNSSRKTGAAAADKALTPSPARYTTKLPGVNGATTRITAVIEP
jgi:hypothetical protein